MIVFTGETTHVSVYLLIKYVYRKTNFPVEADVAKKQQDVGNVTESAMVSVSKIIRYVAMKGKWSGVTVYDRRCRERT